MKKNCILEIKNLCKTYDKFKLNNINIVLEKGSIMGFIGANGAGKATTIKSILNIINYDNGLIYINELDASKNREEINEKIGYFGDEINLYRDSSAKYVYKFIKGFYKNWDDNIFNNLIEKFNLNLDKKINQFSKGMKVQFMLSLALSHHAELFILDEPTSGLDPIIRNDILNILYKIVKNENASVFFSSHITEDIQKIADKITYIDNGNILLSDSKDNILNNYKKVEFGQSIPQQVKNYFQFDDNSKNIIHFKDKDVLENMLDNNVEGITYKTPLLDEILIYLRNKLRG
jgi:ABC-2 type transport system ATP-binding protein